MYVSYFWSQVRHKWYVFQEAFALGVPWLGLIHDWSKFTPKEFKAYALKFYGSSIDGIYPDLESVPSYLKWENKPFITEAEVQEKFEKAWNFHQKRNKHHWQYWLRVNNSTSPKYLAIEMPERYVKEMVADWKGAGKAYGTPNTRKWFLEHEKDIVLHPKTLELVKELLWC